MVCQCFYTLCFLIFIYFLYTRVVKETLKWFQSLDAYVPPKMYLLTSTIETVVPVSLLCIITFSLAQEAKKPTLKDGDVRRKVSNVIESNTQFQGFQSLDITSIPYLRCPWEIPSPGIHSFSSHQESKWRRKDFKAENIPSHLH